MTTANDVVVLGNLPLDDLYQLYEDVNEEMDRMQEPEKSGDDE